MKMGIIGNGVVGSTLAGWFTERGDTVAVYDMLPQRCNNPLEEALACDWVFICINLPDNAKSPESYYKLLRLIDRSNTPNPVVLKTTVLPGTTDRLIAGSEKPVIYNPEWLTEATPEQDFRKPSIQIIGCQIDHAVVAGSLLALLPQAPPKSPSFMLPHEAEILKHVVAAWLSTKVSWFNQLYDAIGEESYAVVTNALKHEPRIGKTHMDIMQDGYRGWGGKCFTKDVPLFASTVEFRLLDEVIEYNRRLRENV